MRKKIKLSISAKSGDVTYSRSGVVEIEKEGCTARLTYDTMDSNLYRMDDTELALVVSLSFVPSVRAMVTMDADMTTVKQVDVADFSIINDKGEIPCRPADDYTFEIESI